MEDTYNAMMKEIRDQCVGKFISIDHLPLEFNLVGHKSDIITGEYIVKFRIDELDIQGKIHHSYYHIFNFGKGWRGYQFEQSRDIKHFLNCLRDIVVDGAYGFVGENDEAYHLVTTDRETNDIYADRMSLNVSDDRSKVIINYLRPPENLARERILLRGSVIKAIYGQGNWVEWNDLWQRLVPVDLNILRQTCDYLESANLLSQFELNKYKLTSSGYSFFEKQILPSTNTVFIIASCDPKHKEWVDYYKKEISAVGLRPYFQEKEEPPREIIIEIYEQLRNCAFVLADLTGGSENCLYELGYAHARGKRIILVRDDSEVRKGKGEKVRLTFDLNQFRHSFRFGKEDWESENNKAFRTELKDRISKVKTDLFETQFFRLTGHE